MASYTRTVQTIWANGSSQLTGTATLVGQIEGGINDTSLASNATTDLAMAWTNTKLQYFFAVCSVNITLFTNGTEQINTATVVAASGITMNGNAIVIITSGILPGSPVTYTIPVTTATTTAATTAAVLRTFLQAQAPLTALYNVGGTGAAIILHALTPAGNDTSLNIDVDNGTCTGLMDEPTSVATLAGVAPQDTLVMTAGVPLEWNVQSGITNPFVGNVTKASFQNLTVTVGALNVQYLATA